MACRERGRVRRGDIRFLIIIGTTTDTVVMRTLIHLAIRRIRNFAGYARGPWTISVLSSVPRALRILRLFSIQRLL